MKTLKRAIVCSFVLFFGVSIFALGAEQKEEIPVTTQSSEARNLFLEGQQELDVGRVLEANALFRKAVQKDPQFAYAYINIANSANSAQEFKESLEQARKVATGKSEGERLLIDINATFLSNDAKKRIELAQQLTAKYPGSARAWLTLAGMQASLNQHEAARTSMSKALQLQPKLSAAHFNMGFSYLFNEPKDFLQAKKFMENCINLDPKEAKGYEGLGDVYRALNDLPKALDAYTKAVEKDPNLSQAVLKKGHINSFLGNYRQARQDYDRGIAGAKESNKVNFANYKAFTHLHEGRPQEALTELNSLYASAPKMGLPKDQVTSARLFIVTNEIQIALHHNLSNEAEDILQRLRETTDQNNKQVSDPNFARQQNAALSFWESQLAARKGDYSTAKAKAQENHKLLENDNNPRRFEGYNACLALVEALQGHHKQAVEYYRKSDLTNIYNKYQLAVSLEKSGNQAEARKLFKEVGEWNFNAVGFALVRKDALKKT